MTKGQGSGRASLKSVECLNTGAQASFRSLSFGWGTFPKLWIEAVRGGVTCGTRHVETLKDEVKLIDTLK